LVTLSRQDTVEVTHSEKDTVAVTHIGKDTGVVTLTGQDTGVASWCCRGQQVNIGQDTDRDTHQGTHLSGVMIGEEQRRGVV